MFDEVRIPRLVVAGVSSGAGKTTVALGLCAALVRRGRVVQTFKVGPDFLDAGYLAHVSQRPCRNLDPWMLGEAGVRRSLARGSVDADCAVIEGVRGIFDGLGISEAARQATPYPFPGSTADVARIAHAPVVLVLDVSSLGETAAAIALGVKQLDPRMRLIGVILNGVPCDYHRAVVEDAVWRLATVPVLGALPRITEAAIPEWDMGLVPVAENEGADAAIDRLAAALERHCDLDLLERLMARAEPLPPAPRNGGVHHDGPRVRLGVAFDEAFNVYYPENLELLEQAGADIVPFSPLEDRGLPRDVDGLYLGGGFSPVHVERLSRNRPMAEAVQRAHLQGLPVYGESGAVLYLARTLRTPDGTVHEMAGALPIDVGLTAQPRVGYRELRLASDCLLGPAGTRLRGHEFHRAEVLSRTDADPAYSMHDSEGEPLGHEGWARGDLLVSSVSLHFGQEPGLAQRMVDRIRAAARRRAEALSTV